MLEHVCSLLAFAVWLLKQKSITQVKQRVFACSLVPGPLFGPSWWHTFNKYLEVAQGDIKKHDMLGCLQGHEDRIEIYVVRRGREVRQWRQGSCLFDDGRPTTVTLTRTCLIDVCYTIYASDNATTLRTHRWFSWEGIVDEDMNRDGRVDRWLMARGCKYVCAVCKQKAFASHAPLCSCHAWNNHESRVTETFSNL